MSISVTIDDQPVVKRIFDTGDGHMNSEFFLSLPPGRATLKARAGDGTLRQFEFDVPTPGHRWAVLSYWASAAYYAPKFTWNVSDERPHFF